MKEAPDSSETSVITRAIWRNIPEDHSCILLYLTKQIAQVVTPRTCTREGQIFNPNWDSVWQVKTDSR
jgi:hypothetical protein